MKIEKNAFSFEESLKYLEKLAQQMTESQGLRVFRNVEMDELPVENVVKVFCVAMSIKVKPKLERTTFHMDYVYAGVVSQIFSIVQSSILLRKVEMQADGGILVLFDTPMKKDVEEVINIAAQVRSINDVVLRKFHMPLDEQVISVGIDYGPISYFSSIYTNYDGLFFGNSIMRAKKLAEVKTDSVNISEDIYMNLSEETQRNLFVNKEMNGEMAYYCSQLINIRMRKWVVENKNG